MSDSPSRRERPRSESPWYCPECELWVGWKLDECATGNHARPRLPLRWDDVRKPAFRVTRRDRVLAKLRWFR